MGPSFAKTEVEHSTQEKKKNKEREREKSGDQINSLQNIILQIY